MKEHILVCDDNPAMLYLYRKVLEYADYNVATCQRAENLFGCIADKRPDAIIVDLAMIGLGGENAVLMLKENPDYNAIPVIISSGNPEIKEIADRVKADAYISKSSDNDELLNLLEKVLHKGG